MNLQEKREKLIQLEEKRLAALEEADRLWREIQPLMKQITNHDLEEHFKDGINFESVLSLPWTRLDRAGSDWHRKISNWLNSHPGIYQSGYYHETDQAGISINLDKDTPWQEQRSIEQAYPYLKPLEDGHIHISIFEHTCSEYGSYYLKVSTQDQPLQIELACKSYGWETVKQTFTTWDEALAYIHKHHWH